MGLCWRNLIFDRFWDRFGSDFGDQKASQKGQKWSRKRCKIEHKIQHKIRRLSRASWIRLGPVLGRLRVDLGVKNSENTSVFIDFCENHVFEEDKAWKGILDGTWVDFSVKKAPKSVPKRIKNGIENQSKNKIDFGSLLRWIRSGRRSKDCPSRSRGGGKGEP